MTRTSAQPLTCHPMHEASRRSQHLGSSLLSTVCVCHMHLQQLCECYLSLLARSCNLYPISLNVCIIPSETASEIGSGIFLYFRHLRLINCNNLIFLSILKIIAIGNSFVFCNEHGNKIAITDTISCKDHSPF